MDCSDQNRRTMSEALRTENFSRSELDFLTGKAETAPTVPVVAIPKHNSPRREPSVKRTTDPAIRNPGQNITPTVSMTFRLPADLPARLIRVSAERKVSCEKPASQQDIVAEALREWFRRNTPTT